MSKLLIASGSSLLIATGSAVLISADSVAADTDPKKLNLLDDGHHVTLRDHSHYATVQENR
jgi:hypothetical protein